MTYLADTEQRQDILHFVPTHFTWIYLMGRYFHYYCIITKIIIKKIKKKRRLHIVCYNYPTITGNLTRRWLTKNIRLHLGDLDVKLSKLRVNIQL